MTESAATEAQQAQNFVFAVLKTFLSDVHQYEADNFDTARYGADQALRFDAARHAFNLNLFVHHQARFFRALRSLEDAESGKLFLALLRYQLAGHLHVRLPTNQPGYFGNNAQLREVKSTATGFPHYGNIQHHELLFNDTALRFDGYLVPSNWLTARRQYFYDHQGVRIAPERGDHVIDAGACMGETCIAFGEAVGAKGWVYGFDVLTPHLELCRHNFAQNPDLAQFKLFSAGLSDVVFEPTIAPPAVDAISPGFSLIGQEPTFPTTTLDHLVAQGEIPRVDLIKMDIEGSEMNALRGAEQTLRRFKPKLAISIYHIFAHYYEVAEYIKSLNLGYKLYLEHYTIHSEETVLYAIAA